MTKKGLEQQVIFFEAITRGRFARDRIVIMVNSPRDLEICLELGLSRSFVCNNNCWLDFDLFNIREGSPKNFDMVINCRPEKNFKRPYLAMDIENLAVIQGAQVRPHDFWDLEQLAPKYMNRDGRIGPSEVIDILNQSWAGGIFSASEGACYASSEYLLCGLPVISTPSEGGRDFWYNDDNSIIVEPDARAIKEAASLEK
ncbi:MAG: glycosyltransferase [Pseudomonadota bacterium]